VSPRVELALRAADAAEALRRHSGIATAAGVGALPVGNALLPRRAVAVCEDVPAGRVGQVREDLPERVDEGLAGVVGAQTGNAAPGAVDDDAGEVVGLVGPRGTFVSIGAIGVVGDEGALVAVGAVDLLPLRHAESVISFLRKYQETSGVCLGS
jgi:hypothetical protein